MFVIINKRKGVSSFKAIKEFAKDNNIKKIGHSGTLDPLATGLLFLATDEDTKLLEFADKGFKTYVATLEFGKTSNTYDVEGLIEVVTDPVIPQKENIIKILNNFFIGRIEQIPPIFSAKKISGKKAYELALKNQKVILKPTTIEVNNIEILEYNYPFLKFSLSVSKGTYIRSIIHDLGQKLKCGAIMVDLERTKLDNHWTIKDAYQELDPFKVLKLDQISLSLSQLYSIQNGMVIENINNFNSVDNILLTYQNQIVAVAKIEDNLVKPKKVFLQKIKKILKF